VLGSLSHPAKQSNEQRHKRAYGRRAICIRFSRVALNIPAKFTGEGHEHDFMQGLHHPTL
jgi:hypothetical protein